MDTKKDISEKKEDSFSRKDFIRTSALLGGCAFLTTNLPFISNAFGSNSNYFSPEIYDELNKPENMIQSVCLQCNTGCSIKAKILSGVVVKIDGNPVSSWTMNPSLPYKSKITDITSIDGHICPKGQAGIQTAYDAYRLRKVLKRAGKRGENKWIAIPFDTAVNEIVEGGRLFANVSGEENRNVEGLRSVMAFTYKDKDVLKKMSSAINEIRQKKGEEKKKVIDEFKTNFKDHLHKMIDPGHPDFGPKNNQMSFIWGRVKGGRSELIKRFTQESYGSVNAHGHTTVCQGSLYFTGKAMSEQYQYDEKGKKVTWTDGEKFYWQADAKNAKFIIFVGSNVVEGGYISLRTSHISEGVANGTLKYAVVDPRFSKLASKAWKWIPGKPGTEGALAIGLMRWIIDNKKYNTAYLSTANKAAAKEINETTWTNASWLVKIEGESGHEKPTTFLRASEAGLGEPEKRVYTKKKNKLVTDALGNPVLDDKGKPKIETIEEVQLDNNKKEITYDYDYMVCLIDGKMVKFDPNDEKNPIKGTLEGEVSVNIKGKNIVCKPAFEFLKKEVNSKSQDEWAKLCDMTTKDMTELAKEFTSYGTKAVYDMHRGVSQHTNGFYNVGAGYVLNMLIGNHDHKGGLIKGNTYGFDGTKDGQPYDIKKNSGTIDFFGIDIIKGGVKFEESTLWDDAKEKQNYPAKRPWYSLSSDVYQEIFPAISDQYPYPTKIAFTYMAAAPYSLPGGHKVIETLVDLEKLPLYIASDILVGECSMYADYIFPDGTYLERWEFQGTQPVTPERVQPVRQPVINPIPETVKVFGQDHPANLEAMLLAIAEKLDLKGFGKDAFGEGKDFKHQDDYYLRAVANLAAGDKWGDEVPDADDDEIKIFLSARRHLSKDVFDAERWKNIIGEKWWKKAIYVLNRGGRKQEYEKAYDGDLITGKYGKLINFYQEKTAKVKNAITGKSNYGHVKYLPIEDSEGKGLTDEKDGYDFSLITCRNAYHTKARTVTNYYLLEISPENAILINSQDAKKKGFKEGDLVQISSATNTKGEWDFKNGKTKPIVGKIQITEGIRPGVVSFTLGHGHWSSGSSDLTIDNELIKGDERRAKGVHANAAFRLDNYLKNTSLCDLAGGSVSFYDTKVNLEKI